MNEALLHLIFKIFHFATGDITDVDLDNNKCTVKIDNVSPVECDLFFSKAHGHTATSTVWGHIDYPSVGDLAFILFHNEQPYIIHYVTGYKNLNDVYENGKLKLNRIKDSEDTDTTPDEKLKIGEFLLRSLGLGDIFFDKFGNIVLDTHKEFVIRIGDRTSDHTISNSDVTLRIGKIKDSSGNVTTKRLNIEFNHAQIQILEDGTINITSDGDINLGNNTTKLACDNFPNCLFTGAVHQIGTVNVKV